MNIFLIIGDDGDDNDGNSVKNVLEMGGGRSVCKQKVEEYKLTLQSISSSEENERKEQ